MSRQLKRFESIDSANEWLSNQSKDLKIIDIDIIPVTKHCTGGEFTQSHDYTEINVIVHYEGNL